MRSTKDLKDIVQDVRGRSKGSASLHRNGKPQRTIAEDQNFENTNPSRQAQYDSMLPGGGTD